MIHRETTNAWKAGFLLALGAMCGLIGLILSAGKSAAGQAFSEPSSPAARFLVWGPSVLLAAGATLVATAVLVLGLDWIRKKA